MNKKALDIKYHITEEDQAVTRGYLVTYLKSQNYVTKEYIQDQNFVTKTEFNELTEEVREFKDAVVVLFDDQRKQLERNIGVMVEEFRSEVRMLAEGLKMQIEASERRWNEQKEINNDVKTDINALKLKARFV
ncbi:MAG: hypothetical protein QG568_64 [Patescibacteria group bacterium]|nr:hypothetical protein [Patescibacteria group bacterium]